MSRQSCMKVDDMKKRFGDLLKKVKWRRVWELGKEDPRRVIHAFKVGFALALVSLLYLMEPFFNGIGKNTMWAVLTVVVVLEFSAGATLCKGLNRGFGTLLAGSLSFLIEFIASESGKVFRAIFIGVAVFVVGFVATYVRFFPYIKKNFDYGVLIFLLTFNLITVSSYRIDNVLAIAHERFYTIAIGCGVCLVMTLFIFPIWSGEDLHNSTVWKLEGLARSIEACVGDYFSNAGLNKPEDDKSLDDEIYEGYKAVVDSKFSDETLAKYSSWEPRHSRNCNKFPWQQYVKLGAVLRQFGYIVVALHGCLQTELQTPLNVRLLFKDPCVRLSVEVSRALHELADSIRERRMCSAEILSDNLQQAIQDLNAAFKSQPKLFLGNDNSNNSSAKYPSTPTSAKRTNHDGVTPREGGRKVLRHTLSTIVITSLEFSETLPFAAFASLLVEAVARLDLVIEQVDELGQVANFKECVRAPGDQVITVTTSKKNYSGPIHLPSHVVE